MQKKQEGKKGVSWTPVLLQTGQGHRGIGRKMSLAVVEGELVWSYLVNQEVSSCGPVSSEPGGK